MKKYKFVGSYTHYTPEFSLKINDNIPYPGDFKIRENDIYMIADLVEKYPEDWIEDGVEPKPTHHELLEMARTIAIEHIFLSEDERGGTIGFVGIEGIEQIYDLFKMYRE